MARSGWHALCENVKNQSSTLHTIHFDSDFVAVPLVTGHIAGHYAGARGLAAGLTPRLLTIVPGNALSWLTFEKMKEVLR